jgi:hypothetical protein
MVFGFTGLAAHQGAAATSCLFNRSASEYGSVFERVANSGPEAR